MEDPGGSGADSAAPSPAGAKSKLDTLSKDDLIKFAKKQMAVMQKMKSKYADLEKEVESLKQQPQSINGSSEDSLLIQELTEKMDALLLQKAEIQQSLVLAHKDLEKTKQQAKDDVAVLQGKLTQMIEGHHSNIAALESRLEESNSKHQEEVAYFQNLLKAREEIDKERESERERQLQAERASAKESVEEVRRTLEAQLQTLQAELQATLEKKNQEIAEVQENYQKDLTQAQQEMENLQEELAQKSLQHEEDMRALEEDCEIERNRLLLLHEELTEQLALKDGFLQDVQEEDEESTQGSGLAKMLALSGINQDESSQGDGDETDSGRLTAVLEDLQSQNTMLQDELTLLSNVKTEMESELEKIKEEFQLEREELEFKINELQMSKENVSLDLDKKRVQEVSKESAINVEEQQALNQELKDLCETLTRDRDSAREECRHMSDRLQHVEKILAEKTNHFISQYEAMKAQGAHDLQELQDKVEQLCQERDTLLLKDKEVKKEMNSLVENKEKDRLEPEGSLTEDMKLKVSVDDQTGSAAELKQTVEELTRRNEEILSQMQVNENTTQDLKDMVRTLTEERDQMKSLLQMRVEEIQQLNEQRAKDLETLLEEKEMELKALKDEKENEVQHLNEEREKMEENLKEEMERGKERVSALEINLKEELERGTETLSALEVTIKELDTERTDLLQKLGEATSGLAKAEEDREVLGSKLSVLEARLEFETSEKHHLELRLNSVSEEAQQAHTSFRELEEKMNEVLRNSSEEAEDFRARVNELGKERDLLKTSLEQAESGVRMEEDQLELQAHIRDLEQERTVLKNSIDELMKDNEGLQKDLFDMKSVSKRINEENHTLQSQVSLTTEEKQENTVSENRERSEYLDQLTEKDAIISQLRSDVAALQSAAQPTSSEENGVSDDITKKIELLEKENKEKEDKMNKIKGVALKAKKELDISKKEIATLNEEIESLKAQREKVNSSMKDIIHGAEGYKNLQIDYDSQTEQLDKERERAEAAEKQITELTKRLSTAVTQHESLSSEKEDLMVGMETMRTTLRQLESKHQELQRQSMSLDKDLVAERAMKEQKMKELSAAVKEVEELTAEVHKQQQQSQLTSQKLEQLHKEVQQNSLMDMEMADYERLVKDLNTKLSVKDEVAEELQTQIDTLSQKEETLKKENESLKSQIDQEEEKMSNIKQMLVKTKKDLADAKKQESSLMMLQASLKGELEANQQQLESFKIEMCDLTAERHRLHEQLKSALEQQQRSNSSLQQRINSLQQERDEAKAELVSTIGEFESYKVRVHNVLKQQRSKTTAQTEGVDSGKVEREQMSLQLDQLKSRLSETQQSLQSSTAELQQLQSEHDTLLERHNKILQENVSKEAELRERLLSVQSENVALRTDLSQSQTDLLSQVETQRQTYREQIRKVQDDHRAIAETLQGQLSRVEEQLFVLQSQNSSLPGHSNRKSLVFDLQRRNADQNHTGSGSVSLTEFQSMAREEGEGMEMTETESLSPALTPLASLEHLLMSPDPKQEPFVWTMEPTKEELSQKLNTVTRSMEHMNSLLHETEATNAVLMEQITLLKSEVRRLERNQEREKSVANLEYLKNVLLQFIFLQSGSERQALLPVIHTMLQLSPEEKSKLAAIAQGATEGPSPRNSGWSSYLHSWSGIK